MILNRLLIVFVTLLASISVSAFTEDYKVLLEDYHNKFDALMSAKKKWPGQLDAARQAVSKSRATYDSSLGVVDQKERLLELADREVEIQVGHLNFLKQITPVAEQLQLIVQSEAVNAGEFSNLSDVTKISLQAKAGVYQDEVTLLATSIDEKDEEIAAIEASPTYQGLVSNYNSLNGQLSSKQSSLGTTNSLLVSLNSDLEWEKSRLSSSEIRETAARNEANRIRNTIIPGLRTQNEQLEIQIEVIEVRKEGREARRDELLGRIARTEAAISEQENRLTQDGADVDAINAELNRLRERLGEQQERLRRIRNNIKADREEIQEKREDIIANLESIGDWLDEASLQDQVVAQESSAQLEISSTIGQLEADIDIQEGNRDALELQIAGLRPQVASAREAIDDFRELNIQPIEKEIASLETNKRIAEGNRDRALAWKARLERQDANMTDAGRRLVAQEERVVEVRESQALIAQEYAAAQQAIVDNKEALNVNIRSFNALVISIERTKAELDELEEAVINFENKIEPKEEEVEDVE